MPQFAGDADLVLNGGTLCMRPHDRRGRFTALLGTHHAPHSRSVYVVVGPLLPHRCRNMRLGGHSVVCHACQD